MLGLRWGRRRGGGRVRGTGTGRRCLSRGRSIGGARTGLRVGLRLRSRSWLGLDRAKAGRRRDGGGAARLACRGGVGGRGYGFVAVRAGAIGLAEATALRTVAVLALGQKTARNLGQRGAGLAVDRMVVVLASRRTAVLGPGQLVGICLRRMAALELVDVVFLG